MSYLRTLLDGVFTKCFEQGRGGIVEPADVESMVKGWGGVTSGDKGVTGLVWLGFCGAPL